MKNKKVFLDFGFFHLDLNEGFTLVEVLIAATVLIIATTWLFSLFNANLIYIQKSRVLTQATYLAQQKMEELRQVPFEELEKLKGVTFNNGEGYILVEPVEADMKKIGVGLKAKPVKFFTLRVKEN